MINLFNLYSPSLLGCLWDVTDVDLDNFIKMTVESLCVNKSKPI